MFRFSKYSPLVPVALVAALTVGCSTLPTQPIVDSNSPGVRADVPAASAASVSASLKIKGQEGGTLSAGIFTVVIPPGAYEGSATITVSQPDPAQPVAVLSIHPNDKNAFAVPVTLTASLPNLDAAWLIQSGMSEQDDFGMWQAMGSSQPDAQTMTVSASLAHFSTYRVDIAYPLAGATGTGAGGDRPSRRTSEMD